ncbi:unnamed protein product [Polarella glacialis]|uniref:Uncharacterized protein n=1 Tax=Polarella glacialis TaxID=89957 RepID=A0A813LAI4_POLGL|nr:unnamed protein product [Polarella glacialis]
MMSAVGVARQGTHSIGSHLLQHSISEAVLRKRVAQRFRSAFSRTVVLAAARTPGRISAASRRAVSIRSPGALDFPRGASGSGSAGSPRALPRTAVRCHVNGRSAQWCFPASVRRRTRAQSLRPNGRCE